MPEQSFAQGRSRGVFAQHLLPAHLPITPVGPVASMCQKSLGELDLYPNPQTPGLKLHSSSPRGELHIPAPRDALVRQRRWLWSHGHQPASGCLTSWHDGPVLAGARWKLQPPGRAVPGCVAGSHTPSLSSFAPAPRQVKRLKPKTRRSANPAQGVRAGGTPGVVSSVLDAKPQPPSRAPIPLRDKGADRTRLVPVLPRSSCCQWHHNDAWAPPALPPAAPFPCSPSPSPHPTWLAPSCTT